VDSNAFRIVSREERREQARLIRLQKLARKESVLARMNELEQDPDVPADKICSILCREFSGDPDRTIRSWVSNEHKNPTKRANALMQKRKDDASGAPSAMAQFDGEYWRVRIPRDQIQGCMHIARDAVRLKSTYLDIYYDKNGVFRGFGRD
jgi:hypothetical protein